MEPDVFGRGEMDAIAVLKCCVGDIPQLLKEVLSLGFKCSFHVLFSVLNACVFPMGQVRCLTKSGPRVL